MLDGARALPYDYAMLGDGLVPTELVANVEVPTFILAAEAMPETAQALADAMPNARFQPMEASAHELPPEVLAPVLKGFLSQPAMKTTPATTFGSRGLGRGLEATCPDIFLRRLKRHPTTGRGQKRSFEQGRFAVRRVVVVEYVFAGRRARLPSRAVGSVRHGAGADV
jgi:hypothetical protein